MPDRRPESLVAALRRACISLGFLSKTTGQESKTRQESVPLSGSFRLLFTGATTRASFGDDHRAINGLLAMAMSGDGRR
jgi:hypothetical protein